MDLQLYYKKIRETEQQLIDSSIIVISLETPDGGREGVRTEVPRRIAAKMLVEGGVRLATPDEVAEFQEQKAEAKRQADQIATASRMQFAVLSASDLRRLKGASQTSKDQV